MGKRSTVEKLPPQLQTAIHAAIARGATIEDLVALVARAGEKISSSAAQRHAAKVRKRIEKIRASNAAATAIVAQLEAVKPGQAGAALTNLAVSEIMNLLINAEFGDFSIPQLTALVTAVGRLVRAEAAAWDRYAAKVDAAIDEAAAEAGIADNAIATVKAAILRHVATA